MLHCLPSPVGRDELVFCLMKGVSGVRHERGRWSGIVSVSVSCESQSVLMSRKVLISSGIVLLTVRLVILIVVVPWRPGSSAIVRRGRNVSIPIRTESLNVAGLIAPPTQSSIGLIIRVVTWVVVGKGTNSWIHNIGGSHTAARMLKVVTLVVLL